MPKPSRSAAQGLVALTLLMGLTLACSGGGSGASAVTTPTGTAPTILTQPAAQVVAAPAAATFTVAASAIALLTVTAASGASQAPSVNADPEGIHIGTVHSAMAGTLGAYAVATPGGTIRYAASNGYLANLNLATGTGTLYNSLAVGAIFNRN